MALTKAKKEKAKGGQRHTNGYFLRPRTQFFHKETVLSPFDITILCKGTVRFSRFAEKT